LGRGVGDELADVEENRRRFAAAVGYEPAALFELSQVHGREVRAVTAADQPELVRAESGDGLVVSGGAAAGVRSADCVPVLVADPVTRSAAALHAGWRGVALGVVPAGVERLIEVSGATASRLVAAIFPHIETCCFEVGQDVAQQLMAAWTAAGGGNASRAEVPSGVLEQRPGEKPHIDLSGIVIQQLLAAGLRRAHIDVVPGCTVCDADRFFSFRRDGQASGRHLTAIIAG
jgi:YfiH family protein